jgi:acylphosphatase
MKQRVHLVLTGRVQGVCFRMGALEKAEELGVTGWVRNRYDGAVEAVAEGEESQVLAFRDWCRRGPPHAHVIHVDESISPASGEFVEFRISHNG